MVKNDKKFYLRGVVSVALNDAELDLCDVKNYAMFTDVAQFTDWIQSFMQANG